MHDFFAAVDTPDESFPAPLNAESFPINLRLYYKFAGETPAELGVVRSLDIFQEALTKRVRSLMNDEQLHRAQGVVDLESTIQIASEELNLSINELVAIPENDSWHYITNHGKQVFTPASFVATALKQLGVFHDLELNAAEFTVADIYKLDIYEKEQARPDICREADFKLPYC